MRYRKLFAFCGIGNPAAFLNDLRAWGLDIAGHKFFPDHHRYTDSDEHEILQRASEAGASGLICTEKDLYNLHAIFYGKSPTFYCSISMQIGNADDFWRTVLSAADSRLDGVQRSSHCGRKNAMRASNCRTRRPCDTFRRGHQAH